MITDKELDFVRQALDMARRAGAQHARATLSKSEEDLVATLDGEVDRVTHCADRSLSLALFVDGRYGSYSTNKLDSASLEGPNGTRRSPSRPPPASAIPRRYGRWWR